MGIVKSATRGDSRAAASSSVKTTMGKKATSTMSTALVSGCRSFGATAVM